MTRSVRVQVVVAASLDRTFVAFTEEVDRWWLRGPGYRELEGSTLTFEAHALVERSGQLVREIARVQEWMAPHRLVLDLGGERVEVTFEKEDDRTRVVVEHHRSGDLTAFQDPIGPFWAGLLARLLRN